MHRWIRFLAAAVTVGTLVLSASSSGRVEAVTRPGEPMVDLEVQSHNSEPTVLFVHGINAKSTQVGFDPIIVPLKDVYEERFAIFDYYQDKRFETSPTDKTCTSGARPLPSPEASIPVIWDGVGTGTCDSMSDLALNAVALDETVKDIYEPAHSKVVIVANSMGAPIVRGFLTYSMFIEDGAAATMVDSLVFLQGAHDGTPRALLATYGLGFGPMSARPGLYNLHPASEFLTWANNDPDLLPFLPTFNFYGDIGITRKSCDWFGDNSDCTVDARQELGDNFIPPGTENPFDTPLSGGAKYRRTSTNSGQNWQWSMTADLEYKPRTFLDPPPFAWAAERPMAHARLGQVNTMNEVMVADCIDGDPVSLTSQMLSVIGGRMNGAPYGCPSNEG